MQVSSFTFTRSKTLTKHKFKSSNLFRWKYWNLIIFPLVPALQFNWNPKIEQHEIEKRGKQRHKLDVSCRVIYIYCLFKHGIDMEYILLFIDPVWSGIFHTHSDLNSFTWGWNMAHDEMLQVCTKVHKHIWTLVPIFRKYRIWLLKQITRKCSQSYQRQWPPWCLTPYHLLGHYHSINNSSLPLQKEIVRNCLGNLRLMRTCYQPLKLQISLSH